MLDYLKPFGIDLFCVNKKFLVFNLVGRNLKVKYRRSVFGLLWTLLSPLSLVVIFYFVFKVVMKVQTPHYLAYLVAGILPWSYFAQSISEGTESLISNIGLITKVPVPIQSFPYVAVVTNFITMFLAVPILLGTTFFSGIPMGKPLLLLPLLFLLLFLVCYGTTLILSILYVYFRDLKHLIAIILQLWFYATPVVYTVAMVPKKYAWVLYANPVGGCFVAFQNILGGGTYPSAGYLISSAIWGVVLLAAALLIFKSSFRNLAENL